MKVKWIRKSYQGSGSYHSDGHCDYADCGKKAKWFVHYEPEAFEGQYPITIGYCTLKHMRRGENLSREEIRRKRI